LSKDFDGGLSICERASGNRTSERQPFVTLRNCTKKKKKNKKRGGGIQVKSSLFVWRQRKSTRRVFERKQIADTFLAGRETNHWHFRSSSSLISARNISICKLIESARPTTRRKDRQTDTRQLPMRFFFFFFFSFLTLKP